MNKLLLHTAQCAALTVHALPVLATETFERKLSTITKLKDGHRDNLPSSYSNCMLDEELLAKIYIGTNILLINSDASNYRPVSLQNVCAYVNFS